MRVLITSLLYYPSIGGNQTLCQQLAEELVELGCEVSVFTANAVKLSQFSDGNPEFLPQEEVINGVRVSRFKIQHSLQNFLFGKIRLRGVYRLRRFFMGDSYEILKNGPYVPAMVSAMGRDKPDVILATNNAAATTYFAYLASKLFKIPLVVMPLTHSAMPWTKEPILKKIYAAADKIITSTLFEKELLALQGIEKNKLSYIGHGIDIDEFNGAEGKRFKTKYHIKEDQVVSYIGRFVEGKGIEMLIEAMEIVRKRSPDTALMLAGSGDKRFEDALRKCLSNMSADGKAKTYHVVNFSDEEKKDAYAASDIFVLASNVDSFGLSNIEAWTSSVPIICCKDTPQETMIDAGKDGLLVRYGDSEDLAQAIIGLLADEPKRKAMGLAGRKKVLENYTMGIYGRRIKSELEGVVTKKVRQ